MEFLTLANGGKFILATNGFLASEEKVELKLVTDESVEQVANAFTPENARTMVVVNEAGTTIQKAVGYVRRGSVITKNEDAVISVKVIREVKDKEGNITTPSGIEEEKGCVVMFSMFKESVEDKVEQNRADIDYLLMMGGEL